MRYGWLMVVVALIAGGTQADALVVCAAKSKKTGTLKEGATMRLRTACKANEETVDAAAVGLQGPQGLAGADGADGAPGAPGLSNVEIVTALGNVIVAASGTSSATADCPSGKKVIGGSAEMNQIVGGALTSTDPTESHPITGESEGWYGVLTATFNEDWQIRVIAICATVAP